MTGAVQGQGEEDRGDFGGYLGLLARDMARVIAHKGRFKRHQISRSFEIVE